VIEKQVLGRGMGRITRFSGAFRILGDKVRRVMLAEFTQVPGE
jgi:hypothetical protein